MLTLVSLEFPLTTSENSWTNEDLFFTVSLFLMIGCEALPGLLWCRGVAVGEHEDGKSHTYYAALPGFLNHLGLHSLQLIRGECKF